MGNTKKSTPREGWGKELEAKMLPQEEPTTAVSVIIPTFNCSEVIGTTLESLQRQAYPELEVIIVDAGSTDRTLEIVNGYASLVSRIYTVAQFNIADMINRGILLASHPYITPLHPGSFYLSDYTFGTFAAAIAVHDFPELLYCGSIQREVKRDPELVHLPFDPHLLQKGQLPATPPACWFKRELFDKAGKFNPHYQLRSGFDFFCRMALREDVSPVAIERVFVDFDYGRFSYGKALRHALETWRIIMENFGFKKALVWLLKLNHLLLIKSLWRRFKLSLAGKK